MLFWNRGWPLYKVTLATEIHIGNRAAQAPRLRRYATKTGKLTNTTPAPSARDLRWSHFDSAANKKQQVTHEISHKSNGRDAFHAPITHLPDARAQLPLHSQCHAGTGLDLDPTKRTSYYRPTKLNNRLTALVHAFTKTDAVFVCLDLEAYEHDTKTILEVGVSTLDTRDLVKSDTMGCVWWDRIRSYHFRIQENVHLINQNWVYGDPDSFLFGTTQQVSQVAALDSCRRLLMGCGAHHQPERKVFLVGHALKNDKIFLNTLGLDLRREAPNIIGEIDTQKFSKTPDLKLSRLLDSLEIPHGHLHNAGNDATYTLRALCLIAAQGLGPNDRSGSAWNSVTGSDISSEETSRLETDSQVLQSRPKPGAQTIMPLETIPSSARYLEWHEAYKETAEDVRIVSENLFMSRELNGLAPGNSEKWTVRASWKMPLSERRASRLHTNKYLWNKLREQSADWKFPDAIQRNYRLEYMRKLAEYNVIQEELFLLTGRTSFPSDKDPDNSLPFRKYQANTDTNTMFRQRLDWQTQINEAIESELKMLVPGWISPILRTNNNGQPDSISANQIYDKQQLVHDTVAN